MNTPSLLAEFSGLPFRRFSVIVGEANTDLAITRSIKGRFYLHRLADAIWTNSHSQLKFIQTHAPWLTSRLSLIINCVDLNLFHPPKTEPTSDAIRLLVVSRFDPHKNFMTLLTALERVKQTAPAINITVDWYGNNFFTDGKPTKLSASYMELQKGD